MAVKVNLDAHTNACIHWLLDCVVSVDNHTASKLTREITSINIDLSKPQRNLKAELPIAITNPIEKKRIAFLGSETQKMINVIVHHVVSLFFSS